MHRGGLPEGVHAARERDKDIGEDFFMFVSKNFGSSLVDVSVIVVAVDVALFVAAVVVVLVNAVVVVVVGCYAIVFYVINDQRLRCCSFSSPEPPSLCRAISLSAPPSRPPAPNRKKQSSLYAGCEEVDGVSSLRQISHRFTSPHTYSE